MNYNIEEIKYGFNEGPDICAIGLSSVVVSIKISDGTNLKWISNVEIVGVPQFFLSNENIFEKLMQDDPDKKVFKKYYIRDYNGINLDGYDEIYESVKNNVDIGDAKLIKLLIWITRCECEKIDDIIKTCQGKNILDINIPVVDVEKVSKNRRR